MSPSTSRVEYRAPRSALGSDPRSGRPLSAPSPPGPPPRPSPAASRSSPCAGHPGEGGPQLGQRLGDQPAEHHVDDEGHGRRHGQEEHHVRHDGVAHVREGRIGGHYHRHGAGHVPHLPALLGVARGVYLAGRLAVALDAVLGNVHGAHVAKDLLVLLGLEAPGFVGAALGQKALDSGRLVGVGRVVDIAGVQVGEADGVVGLLREQGRHGLAGDGAVQPLVVVVAGGSVVDDALVKRDEVPYRIHLGDEYARLLEKVGLGPASLVVVGEHEEHRRDDHEHSGQKADELRPQSDGALFSPATHHAVRAFCGPAPLSVLAVPHRSLPCRYGW